MNHVIIPLPWFQVPISELHTLTISHRYQATPSASPAVATEPPLCEALTLPVSTHHSHLPLSCSTSIPVPWKASWLAWWVNGTLLQHAVLHMCAWVHCVCFVCNLLFLFQKLLTLGCPCNSCKRRLCKRNSGLQATTHSRWAPSGAFFLHFLRWFPAVAEVSIWTSFDHGTHSHPGVTLAFLSDSALMRSERCNRRAHSEVAIT